MPNIIYLKIDRKKIDSSRVFIGKNGAEYYDLVCVPSANSKYGDTHFVTQSCSKEERLNGLKMPIIGNAKEQAPRGQPASADAHAPTQTHTTWNEPRQPDSAAPNPAEWLDGDIPF